MRLGNTTCLRGSVALGSSPLDRSEAEGRASLPLPLVSVIIGCYGRLDYTQAIVASLARHAGCEYELILVDDGCPQKTWEWAQARDIACVRMPKNGGVPLAYNAGVAAARGGILSFWNNDMECHPGGLERLAQACRVRGMAAQTGNSFSGSGEYLGPTGGQHWADAAEGYCLTAERAVWDAVGGWDNAFAPSYSDDADWCLRARLAGFDFLLVPDCVTHFGQGSFGSRDVRALIAAHERELRRRYLSLGLGQRILVVRWAAAGDILMTTPTLRALRAPAPLARLHVYADPTAGQVLLGNRNVDAVLQGEIEPRRYTRLIQLDNAYETGQKRGEYVHPVLAYCAAAGVEYDGLPYDFHVPALLQAEATRSLPC